MKVVLKKQPMNKKSQLYWLPKIKQNFFKTMLGAKR